VDADLLDAAALDKAIEGATYVVHTASPVIGSNNEDELVKPAVEGTMAVLHSAHKHRVKRLVITSSMAAVMAMA
jgi:dihydroflavonol-4-reductase